MLPPSGGGWYSGIKITRKSDAANELAGTGQWNLHRGGEIGR